MFLELISVRDGACCLHQFDDELMVTSLTVFLGCGLYSVSQKTSPTFSAVTLESIVGFS